MVVSGVVESGRFEVLVVVLAFRFVLGLFILIFSYIFLYFLGITCFVVSVIFLDCRFLLFRIFCVIKGMCVFL